MTSWLSRRRRKFEEAFNHITTLSIGKNDTERSVENFLRETQRGFTEISISGSFAQDCPLLWAAIQRSCRRLEALLCVSPPIAILAAGVSCTKLKKLTLISPPARVTMRLLIETVKTAADLEELSITHDTVMEEMSERTAVDLFSHMPKLRIFKVNFAFPLTERVCAALSKLTHLEHFHPCFSTPGPQDGAADPVKVERAFVDFLTSCPRLEELKLTSGAAFPSQRPVVLPQLRKLIAQTLLPPMELPSLTSLDMRLNTLDGQPCRLPSCPYVESVSLSVLGPTNSELLADICTLWPRVQQLTLRLSRRDHRGLITPHMLREMTRCWPELKQLSVPYQHHSPLFIRELLRRLPKLEVLRFSLISRHTIPPQNPTRSVKPELQQAETEVLAAWTKESATALQGPALSNRLRSLTLDGPVDQQLLSDLQSIKLDELLVVDDQDRKSPVVLDSFLLQQSVAHPGFIGPNFHLFDPQDPSASRLLTADPSLSSLRSLVLISSHLRDRDIAQLASLCPNLAEIVVGSTHCSEMLLAYLAACSHPELVSLSVQVPQIDLSLLLQVLPSMVVSQLHPKLTTIKFTLPDQHMPTADQWTAFAEEASAEDSMSHSFRGWCSTSLRLISPAGLIRKFPPNP